MFYCKNCAYEGDYVGSVCPSCKKEIILDEEEIEDRKNLLAQAKEAKEFEAIVENYHILADANITEAEREYAKILEAGKFVTRDYVRATEYFYRAAKKNDPEAAYRYSRLAGRENADTGRFWLIYSAILGSSEAYAPLAEEFSRLGLEKDAHYFYYLASKSGKADGIVTMAERYYNGIGTEKSENYAKWYMDKLTLPPIYAIKLAYKLRSVTAEEPPKITLSNYDALLARLVLEAEECGFHSAKLRLTEILAERGSVSALLSLGIMKTEGEYCERDTEEGLKCLYKAAAAGNADANLYLGDLYIEGEVLEFDIDRAIDSYERAGKLGDARGYIKIGDLFKEGKRVGKNLFLAIDHYEIAESCGCEVGKLKAQELRRERDSLLLEAINAQNNGAYEDAFRYAALACECGSSKAAMILADCLKDGLGTKVNRRHAFLWYKFASERGEPGALYQLGICYSEGIGTNRDYSLAKEILIKAENEGDGRAHEAIVGMMQRKLEKIKDRLYSAAMHLIYKRKFDDALNLLELSKDIEHGKSIYTLGCFYEFGIHVPCNKELAFSLYERAFAIGFRDPRANYKLKILKMIR